MGHLIKTEVFGQGNDLEASFAVRVPDWIGIWQAVLAEMERSGKKPSGMEEFDDGAVKETIRSVWEFDDLRTGSYFFPGASWSSVTVSWDGE